MLYHTTASKVFMFLYIFVGSKPDFTLYFNCKTLLQIQVKKICPNYFLGPSI